MTMELLKAFNFSKQGVISLIGGGGKTSLMFDLAKALVQSGRTVLTTSTTKIFYPSKNDSPELIITQDMDDLMQKSRRLLKEVPHFTAGCSLDPEKGKIIGFSSQFIDKLWEQHLFDWIIVEADGARRMPIKSSADHEPVIPPKSTHLILVTGLDAVGTPLDDHHVHRSEIFSQNTGLPMGSALTEKSMSIGLAVEMKKAKNSCPHAFGTVFLNKADTPDEINSGKKIATYLLQPSIPDLRSEPIPDHTNSPVSDSVPDSIITPLIDQVIIAALHDASPVKFYSPPGN